MNLSSKMSIVSLKICMIDSAYWYDFRIAIDLKDV